MPRIPLFCSAAAGGHLVDSGAVKRQTATTHRSTNTSVITVVEMKDSIKNYYVIHHAAMRYTSSFITSVEKEVMFSSASVCLLDQD